MNDGNNFRRMKDRTHNVNELLLDPPPLSWKSPPQRIGARLRTSFLETLGNDFHGIDQILPVGSR